MKKQNSYLHPIDDLLKQTLKDDLPIEVENRLYIHLRRFQEKTAKQKTFILNGDGFLKKIFTAFTGVNLEWGLMRLLIKSTALVFAFVVFVILLVTAGFVPLNDSRNALAESLSTLTTSLNVSQQISRSNGMDCSVETVTGKGRHLNYSIKWTPGWTRVQVIGPDHIIVKTLQIKNDRVTIMDHTNNILRRVKDLEHLDDPQFQPVMDFISPAHLQERMQVKWNPGLYRKWGDCDAETFTVLNSREKADMEIMVDLCTFLPIEMTTYRPIPTLPGEEEDIVIRVQFAWETLPTIPRLIEQKS